MNYEQLPPEQQAYLAERLSGRPKGRGRCPIPKRSYPGPAPLSFAQEGIWFASQLAPDLAVYNVAFTIPLPARTAADTVRRALTELARRHEILRTELLSSDGVPMQRASPGFAVDLREIESPEGEGADLLKGMVTRPFSLTHAPLWRCCLFPTEAGTNLFIVIHHLIADGWSISEMSREVLRLCTSPLGDDDLDSQPQIQYADFAVWQRQRFEAGELEQHLRYWRKKLAGVPTLCTLPADRSRSAAASFRGETRFFTLGPELTARLKGFAQQEEATLFMVLLAAFKALLWRYSGQADVTVGSPFACRTLPVLERVLGCFVNLLPLRTTLTEGCSFRDLVALVKATVLEAHAHEEYPFDRIVDAVRPERSLGVNPLFQTVFSLRDQQEAGEDDGQDSSETVTLSGTSKFDLTLVLSWTQGGLTGAVEYNTDLFTAELITQFVDHYQTFLASVAGDPQVPVGLARIFSDPQYGLLAGLNATDVPLASRSILEILLPATEEFEADVAVSFGDQHLTCGQLRALSQGVARRLIELGAKPNDLIGLCIGPSLDLLPCLLGTLMAGCAYVPLDPGYPEERLAFMMEDADARIVIAAPAFAGKLAAAGRQVITTREIAAVAAPAAPARQEVGEQDLVYMIYTSGSTGYPKGAKVLHRGLANLIQWFLSEFAISREDRFLVISSFSFDLTQKNLFAPLCAGARIFFPAAGYFDPLEIARAISRHRITVINCTPSAFCAILDASGRDYDLLSSLRWVILGGEPISRERLRGWLESPHCRARIGNTYGPTECSDIAAFFKLETVGPEIDAPVPIGKPVWNARLAVVDERGQLAPLGAVGELWISGLGVGAGYHKRPELNEAKFVRHAFEPLPEAVWYRTGDLVRYGPEGELVFVGRLDQQLKVRGFRVELEEIENVLARHPGVDGAVVLADGGGDSAGIRAFVTPSDRTPRSLRNVLALSSNGALEGKLLIDLPNGLPVVVPNRPETEFLYREIWAEETYFRHGIAIGDGNCVFDVGANAGLFSLYAASKARDLEIFAFEPIPPLFEMLRENLSIHGVAARCFEIGVSSQAGSARFTYYPHVSIISGMYGDAEEDKATMRTFLSQSFAEQRAAVGERDLEDLLANRLETERFHCPLRRLSEVIGEQGVQRIDLLKVDVEKSELEVLAGIDPEHWPRIQQVVLEVHDHDGSLAAVLALLRDKGFTAVSEQASRLAQTGLYNVYARRPDYMTGQATPAFVSDSLPASPQQLERRLQRFAADHLPDYMVPSSVVVLERFPTTPSGKVDRRALATRPLERRTAGLAPRTTMEEELASLWCEILNLEQVGVEDNFFEIGGHSLKAAQLAARVREEFAIDFSVRSVFQHSRISLLAAHITATILQEMAGSGASR